MHTIKFPIATGKEKEKILAKGFRAMVQFHNIMVREAKRRLWHLQHDPEYQRLRTEYGQTAKKKDEAEKKRLGKLLNECIKCYDLTEHSFMEMGKNSISKNGKISTLSRQRAGMGFGTMIHIMRNTIKRTSFPNIRMRSNTMDASSR